MRRFGFVRTDFNEQGMYQVRTYAQQENGKSFHTSKPDDVASHLVPPAGVWFESEAARDVEMDFCARKFPGVAFAPVDLKSAIKYAPAKNPSQFEISHKGVLPK